MGYFTVKLINGSILDMDHQCNSVDYEDKTMCIFKDLNEFTGSYEVLAIIPYDKILCILKK